MNKIWITGRLVDAPELRYTPNGTANCSFTVAVDRPFKNGEGERDTDFFPVVVWRQLGETCANYLVKGQKVSLVARLQNRKYELKEVPGKKITVTELIAEEVEFGEKPQGHSANNAAPNGNSGNRSNGTQGGNQNSGNQPAANQQPVDDGLPF